MKKVARLRASYEQDSTMNQSGGANGLTNVPEQIGVRTTGRIKKPKTVFDPSDNYLPRSQRASVSSISQLNGTSCNSINQQHLSNATNNSVKNELRRLSCNDRKSDGSFGSNNISFTVSEKNGGDNSVTEKAELCAICLKPEPRRGHLAKSNKFFSCLDCDRKVHKLCLHVEFEDLAVLRKNFKCENCRTCCTCDLFNVDRKNRDLITCIKCCKSYHLTCHTPNVSKLEQYQKFWKCVKCSPDAENHNANLIANDSVLPSKAIREIIGDNGQKLKNNERKSLSLTAPTPSTSPVTATSPNSSKPILINGNAVALKTDDHDQNLSNLSTNPTSVSLISSSSSALSDSDSMNLLANTNDNVSSTKCTNENIFNNSIKINRSSIDNEDYKVIIKKKKSNGNSTDSSDSLNNCTGTHFVENNGNTELQKMTSISFKYNPNDAIDIPDVKDWSIDQVVTFFSKYFPKEAYIFRDHEIDGTSLLLLKRSDVIKKLSIKLGPSLRLYNLILKIQTKSNDPTLGWNCGN